MIIHKGILSTLKSQNIPERFVIDHKEKVLVKSQPILWLIKDFFYLSQTCQWYITGLFWHCLSEEMTFETVYNTILYHYDVQLTGIQFVVLLLSVCVYLRKYFRYIKSSKAFVKSVLMFSTEYMYEYVL